MDDTHKGSRNHQEVYWYPLDASVHNSANIRLSALHLPSKASDVRALCDPHLYLCRVDGYSKLEARVHGRKLCKTCERKDKPHES